MNALRRQFRANAFTMRVIAGPTETTVIGNIVTRGVTYRDLSNLAETHKVMWQTFHPKTHIPQEEDVRDEVYACFLTIQVSL